MSTWERRARFIGNFEEEAPSYLENLREGWQSFFMSKTKLAVGWSFISWSKLYLEGWTSRSRFRHFIGVTS